MTNTPLESPFPRYVAVEGVDDETLRETHGIAADVAVADNEVTANDTARVEVALRTTGDEERTVTYEQANCGRNEFRADTGGYGLFLLPAGGDWTTGDTDCPVVGYPNLDCGIPVVGETVTLSATDPVVWRYDVVVPPRNVDGGGCVVLGRYRYTREFTAAESSATLAFDLSVTAP